MNKSAGFDLQIVLPANTCQEKVFKKIQKALPKGTALTMVANTLTQSEVKPGFGESRPKREGAISVNM